MKRKGLSYIEVLVANFLVFVCLAGLFSMWSFNQNVTHRTQHEGVAYNLARRTMEGIKQTGFLGTPEIPANAPQVQYFNSALQPRAANASDADYIVSSTVVTDSLVEGSSPPQPALTALRTVTIRVRLRDTNELLCEMTTLFARDGV